MFLPAVAGVDDDEAPAFALGFFVAFSVGGGFDLHGVDSFQRGRASNVNRLQQGNQRGRTARLPRGARHRHQGHDQQGHDAAMRSTGLGFGGAVGRLARAAAPATRPW